MQGFHPQKHKAAKPKNYANGGIVTGPGSGTSDSVPAMVPADGYVMPADSVQAIGFKPGMRAAQLSDGEAVLNPQQVQAAGGFKALDAMKNATHTPVPEQGAEGPKFFFANGGMTDDERRKALDQIPNSAPAGWTGGQGERVTGNDFTRNVSNTMNALAPVAGAAAPIVSGVARGFGVGAKAAAASPLLEKAAAYGVPAAGFGALAMAANDKPATEQAPGMTPPASRAMPVTQPAADSLASGQPEKPGTPAAQANMQAAGNVSVRRQPNGVMEFSGENVSGDVSYSGPAGFKPRGAVSEQNMAAADSLAQRSAARGFTPRGQTPEPQTTPAVIPQDTGGYGLLDKNRIALRNAMIDANQGDAGGKTVVKALLQQQADAPGQQIERDRLAQSATNSAADRGFRSRELDARMGDSAANRDLKAQELADNSATNSVKRDAAGVELAVAKQLADLRTAYLNAKTPEEQAVVAKKLQALSGKTQQEEWKPVTLQGGTDAMGNKTESVMGAVNSRTGEMRRYDGQQAQQSNPSTPPASGTIKNGYRFKGGDPSQQANWEKV
jgi:hypothetical protein